MFFIFFHWVPLNFKNFQLFLYLKLASQATIAQSNSVAQSSSAQDERTSSFLFKNQFVLSISDLINMPSGYKRIALE